MMVEHNQSANVPSGVGYDNKYKFNGKELDDATQMYYYGARYYDPRISIFVSVDPLAEKFVGRSPYEYCFNNPINLIDPTGMSPTGGPGGPPVKNLYIVLDYNKAGRQGKDAERDIIRFEGMENEGWIGFRANTIREANATLSAKYSDQKFDNVVIETHGSTGGSIQDTYSILETNNNDIKNTRAYEINYKNMRAGGNTDVNALISITSYLNEGGNLIFNACNLGMDSRFMGELGKLTNNKFNIYFPIGLSQQYWQNSDTSGTAIYNPSALFNKNILDEHGGYLSPAGGGENKKIESLKINSNGIQCED